MKIKAAVLQAMGATPPYAVSRPLRIEEIDLARPGADEVLIKIAAAGLCHSDLSVINGDRPRPMPMALGHEASGVAEELGAGVTDLQVGDHVVVQLVAGFSSESNLSASPAQTGFLSFGREIG
ncbi:Alcohol dehydrogenase [Caballeronia sordidicola]|uniref:Alcohol dehydrogenase n=2 Tax=Caballeronia sordidicola TaxID=196367 RepID=A0A242N5K8_CABSO|nr:Alcohol dehydrogenase [Caballeronia sordidicola]